MANAKTGFKGVNDPVDEKEHAEAVKDLPEKGGVYSEEDRPVRSDNLSVGGASQVKESR